MAEFTETLKKHKTAIAVGVAGFVFVIYLLRRGSSGATSQSSALQLAQLQSQQNLAQAQIQAQQNAAQLSANVQETETSASLEGQQDQLATEAALQLNSQGSAFTLAQEQEQNQTMQESAYDSLVAGIAPGIASSIPTLAGHEALQETELNELALLLGSSTGVNSYNNSISQEAESGQVNNPLNQLLASLGSTSSTGGTGLAGITNLTL